MNERTTRRHAHESRTATLMHLTALSAYALAVVGLIVAVLRGDRWDAPSIGLAVLGLAVDMRRLSLYVVRRTVHTVALWQDDVEADE